MSRLVDEQALAMSPRGGLATIRDAQLGEDMRDVDAGGLGRDEQGLADLVVSIALGEQAQHVDLALGEAVHTFVGPVAALIVSEPNAPTSRGLSDGVDERLRAEVLTDG